MNTPVTPIPKLLSVESTTVRALEDKAEELVNSALDHTTLSEPGLRRVAGQLVVDMVLKELGIGIEFVGED